MTAPPVQVHRLRPPPSAGRRAGRREWIVDIYGFMIGTPPEEPQKSSAEKRPIAAPARKLMNQAEIATGYVIGASLAMAAAGFAVLSQIGDADGLAVVITGLVLVFAGLMPVVALGSRHRPRCRSAGACESCIGDLGDHPAVRGRWASRSWAASALPLAAAR